MRLSPTKQYRGICEICVSKKWNPCEQRSGICVRLSGGGEDAGEGAAGVDAQAARGKVFVGVAAATFAIPCDVFGFQSRFE